MSQRAIQPASKYELTFFDAQGERLFANQPWKRAPLRDDIPRELQFMEIAQARAPEVDSYRVHLVSPTEARRRLRAQKVQAFLERVGESVAPGYLGGIEGYLNAAMLAEQQRSADS